MLKEEKEQLARLKRQEDFNEWMRTKVKSVHYANNNKMNIAIANIQ